MKSKTIFCVFVLFFFQEINVFAQENGKNLFWEAELMTGAIVPNFPSFPQTGVNKSFSVGVGKTAISNEHWVNYYNKPSFGLSFSYTESSNTKELGREYGSLIFMELNPSKKENLDWLFRLGIGSSYFTKHFEVGTNESNTIIGSHWNWRFHAFIYRKIKNFSSLSLSMGAGYVHSSNGHTQLPNYGMNSAMLSLSARFYKNNPYLRQENFERKGFERKKRTSFLQSKFGVGVQEFGGTTKPIGSEKKGIYAASFMYGWLFNQQFKLRTGFTYRYYQHYYEDIKRTNNKYANKPNWNASNLFWLLGVEYLFGNFAIDIEGGINIYKPYYSEFFDKFETAQGIKKFMKATFPMRMGLNYYFVKPSKNRMYNFYMGASINANFGQADFSQLNLGVYKRVGKN